MSKKELHSNGKRQKRDFANGAGERPLRIFFS